MGHVQCIGHPDQVRDRGGSHFLHDLGSMDLQREFTDTELPRGLLVAQTAGHEVHHLTLACRQTGIAPAQLSFRSALRTRVTVVDDRRPDRLQQLGRLERNRQEIQRA